MTIDEAIRVLESRLLSPFVKANPKSGAAIQLGIEALRRIKAWRTDPEWELAGESLPGETE